MYYMDSFKKGELVIVIGHFAKPRICVYQLDNDDQDYNCCVVSKYGGDTNYRVKKALVVPYTEFAKLLYL